MQLSHFKASSTLDLSFRHFGTGLPEAYVALLKVLNEICGMLAYINLDRNGTENDGGNVGAC
jgi:hypothetical protein